MVRACVSVCNHNRRRAQWWTEMAPFLRSALLNLFMLHMLEIVGVTLTSSLTQHWLDHDLHQGRHSVFQGVSRSY